ncbi:MAG: YkgJ family cysteine cluster protein [Gammaproteobacteria bacterium]|nr:YkgJ family cysteine cluster protein [Gammaproteobacteria bacterium]
MNAKNTIKLKDVTAAGSVSSTITIDKKCTKCTQSICCVSINQPIKAPKSREDFDHLLWQVSHENISVFKDSDGWFLLIATRCSHLGEGGVCNIYDQRPWVCRDYKNDFCEFDESIEAASTYFFSSYLQLEEYCRKRFKNWEKRFELFS